jgi:hypothetical protein
MFSLPNEFLASTTQMIGQIFSDLEGLIILILGLSIGFWVIFKLIDSLKKILGK